MKGGADVEWQEAAHAVRLGELGGSVDGGLGAGNDGLRRLVVVGELACLALRSLRGQLLGRLLADAQQRRHGTLADRHCRLHSLAARLQETGSIGHADGAGCGKR